MPHAMTLTAVRANVATAPVGSDITVDIYHGATTASRTSLLSPKLHIDDGEKTSTTATQAHSFISTSLTDDTEITIDITAVEARPRALA